MFCGFLTLHRIFDSGNIKEIRVNPEYLIHFYEDDYKEHYYGYEPKKIKACRIIGTNFDFYVTESGNEIIDQCSAFYKWNLDRLKG